MRDKREPKITCSIFQKQELVIKDITDKINKAKGVREKAKFAQELKKEADVLLTCGDYKEVLMDCKNCRFIANLRGRTADLIVKAKKME